MWICPREYLVLLWQENSRIIRIIFLMIFYVDVLGMILYLICGELRGLLVKSDIEYLVLLLKLLLHKQMLTPVVLSLVAIKDVHPSDLIQ